MKPGRPRRVAIRSLIARLLPSLARYRGRLLWGVLFVTLTNVFTLIQPQVLRYAVDDLYRGVTAEKLGRYGLILFGIALVAAVFRYLMRQTLIAASRWIEFDLRNDLFEHLERLPPEYYQRQRTGEVMSRATNDLSAVRNMLGPGIMNLVSTSVMAVLAIGFMLAISPRLTLVSLLPLPFVSFTVWYFGERIHRRFEAIQSHFAQLSARVQENLAGVRVVRAFARERGEREDFESLNREYLGRNLALIRTSGVFYPALEVLNGLATLLALWIGGQLVIAGRITLGEFVAFLWYLGMLSWPMVALGWVTNLFQRGLASWGRILAILDTVPSITSLPGAVTPDTCAGAIEIRHLTFRYPDADRPALRDLSFRVPAGRTLAIVGRTGAGKSTLLHLLARLFDPPPGTVWLDGRDVRDLDLAWLRRQMAIVPQEAFLFSATVAENLAYGVEHAEDEEIRRAAAMARLDEEIDRFPQGYGTRVGERGITLSGGQRQRATIARALLRNAPLLLLDDCLSSVDTETEAGILRGLASEMRRHTTLIVSHRVSAVRGADSILVLEDGGIVEQGTHDELIARGGPYAELAHRQQLEEELEAS